MKNALLQHQKINHVVTKKLKNVVRMKGIVIWTVIAKLVSSAALITVQVVSHHFMIVVINHQVLFTYCGEAIKCGENEGDCDNDSHCKAGLKCGTDNCPSNFPSYYDCCYKESGNSLDPIDCTASAPNNSGFLSSYSNSSSNNNNNSSSNNNNNSISSR